MTSAIKYLHDIDIAHRDIKPENIVLSHVNLLLLREFLNYAILDGPLGVLIEERHIVVPLITLPPRSLREKNMIGALTYGV